MSIEGWPKFEYKHCAIVTLLGIIETGRLNSFAN